MNNNERLENLRVFLDKKEASDLDSSDIPFDSITQIVSSGPIKKKVQVKSTENKAIKKIIQTKKRARKT